MKSIAVLIAVSAVSLSAFAKLPAPSDEAKAKAAEAAAKTAHGNKVADFQLCKSQDKAAAPYRKTSKNAPKPTATPACADPGPFVYNPAGAAAAPAPAAPAPAAKKKS